MCLAFASSKSYAFVGIDNYSVWCCNFPLIESCLLRHAVMGGERALSPVISRVTMCVTYLRDFAEVGFYDNQIRFQFYMITMRSRGLLLIFLIIIIFHTH